MRLGFGLSFLSARVAHGKLDGIGVYTKALWRAFEDIDSMELSPLSFSSSDDISLTEELLGSKVLGTPLSYPIHSGISSILGRPIGELGSYEKSIDMFFAPDHHIPFLKSTPVVATVMDIIPFIEPQWASGRLRRVKNFAFQRAVESSQHIITVSQHSKRDIIEYFDVDDNSISVVPLGVDSRFFERVDLGYIEEIRARYHIDRDFFLFVGTLQPRKNILRIIESYMALPKSAREESMLVLVGQDGWGSSELKKKIDEMVKDGAGLWLSYLPQDEVYALMQSAKAIVYPSLYEGFGLPILEAFASQTPIITSTTTSMPEVAGDAALLVDPYSIDEISSAMHRIIDDASICSKLVSMGSKRVEKFSWKNSAKRHIELFETIW